MFWYPAQGGEHMGEKVNSGSGRNFQPVNSSGTGFQPVNPWRAYELAFQRRNLSHVQAPAATYFVTFRCCRGWSLPQPARSLTLSAVRYWDARRIDLDAAVVMPDAHAMFRILDGSSLSTILHSIKSFSSTSVNRLLRRRARYGSMRASIMSCARK